MSEFVIVTGMGHCGTKWVKNLLDRPSQGVRFFHEQKVRMCGQSYWGAMRQGYDYHAPYFEFMNMVLSQYRIVGDANSWHVGQVPELANRLPLTRCIVLVRNGILQLRSIHLDKRPVQPRWLDVYVRDYWKIAGKPYGDFDKMTTWEKLCVWWAVLPKVVKMFSQYVPEVEMTIYPMEDLVSEIGWAHFLLSEFGLQMNRDDIWGWQRVDIHPHIQVTNTRIPSVIYYEIFKPEQREAYERICGDTAREFSYDIPTRESYERAR